ncbi:sensor histidine kinase [Geomonas subterranea]|uniref:histidine kinase n=1 Tax=Geomonas subterranea TaxID=2847989 RepID=A0ABX8LJ05_9BACT|nr:ATP-binding protein [Geomonas subterranea]QXE91998.1 sensor histidine kinase [Geomonas subterranea]QXM09909.1 sensor histidine kinase [Geomonas subterranea]
MEVPISNKGRKAGTRNSSGSGGGSDGAKRNGSRSGQQEGGGQPEELGGDCERRLADAQRELGRLNEELARQKASADNLGRELETFSYSVSHDLRAPLRHLIGFSNALLEDYGEGLEPTAHSYLDCIVRAGRKMEALVDALLALSRIGRQDMTLLNLDLSQMANSYAACIREADPGRKVTFSIPERLPAHGDAVLLRTALEHLLENAWKFTARKESATIELGSRKDGDEVVYFVRDNGAGFDMRFADRLFGPFQRMHREEEFPGMGIGLAIVQRIINRHCGRIWAEAEVNEGATFYFTLGS